jgi:hypothetical protein
MRAAIARDAADHDFEFARFVRLARVNRHAETETWRSTAVRPVSLVVRCHAKISNLEVPPCWPQPSLTQSQRKPQRPQHPPQRPRPCHAS